MYSNQTQDNIKRKMSAFPGVAENCDNFDNMTNGVVRCKKQSRKSANKEELSMAEN